MMKAVTSMITKGLISFSVLYTKASYIIAIVGAIIMFASAHNSIAQAGFKNAEKGVVTTLQPKEAYELINKNSGNADFIILDIRTTREFLNGHISGAVNVDCYSRTFDADIEQLDKEKIYLIYCRTGKRTSEVIRKMLRKGFENIYTFHGDIVAWQALGLPLVKGIQDKKY